MATKEIKISVKPLFVNIEVVNEITANEDVSFSEPQFITNIPYDIFIAMVENYNKNFQTKSPL